MCCSEHTPTQYAWEHVSKAADATAARLAVWRSVQETTTVDDVEVAIQSLARIASQEVKAHKEAAAAAWKRWVAEAIRNGASAAHRWANARNKPVLTVTAPGTLDPCSIVAHHSKGWQKIWHGEPEPIRRALREVMELRQQLLASSTPSTWASSIGPAFVRKLANDFKKRTGIGADELSFQEVAHATDEALVDLCDLFKSCVLELAFPIQCLFTQLSLLAKKLGGTRAIALSTTFIRLLLATGKGPVREWDKRVAMPGDTGRPGVSLELETSRRHLQVEVARALGMQVALLLWDVEKFYDTSKVHHTIAAAQELGFPSEQLCLASISHRAPRVMKCDGCMGEIMQSTGQSMLAGCAYATSMSRARIVRVRRKLPFQIGHSVFQQVDDLTQLTVGGPDRPVAAIAADLGVKLADALVADGYTISSKSTVVASSPAIANKIAGYVRSKGYPVKISKEADDVGVSTTAGSRRAVASQAVRAQKISTRSFRVGVMARQNWHASKMHKTGCIPAGKYGGHAQGFAPSRISQLRTAAAKTVPSPGSKPCITTLLSWRLGDDADPFMFCKVGQVKQWMQLCTTMELRDRLMLKKAWKSFLPDMLQKSRSWRGVTGPARATIAVLASIGWSPTWQTRWADADRTHNASADATDPGDKAAVLRAVTAAVNKQRWQSSADHFLGKGLEAGVPSLAVAAKVRSKLVKDKQPELVKALDAVVCGAVVMGGRYDSDVPCAWCGLPESPLHRYWTCKCLAKSNDEHIVKSQFLVAEACNGACGFEAYPCLWGRAILPAPLYDVGQQDKEVSSASVRHTPNLPELAARLNEFYPDGSGGPAHAPIHERAHGSGVAVVDFSSSLDEGPITIREVALLASPVPGYQSVPRAELWAATQGIRHASPEAEVTVHPDATYVHDGITRIAAGQEHSPSANGEAWKELKDEISGRVVTSRRAPAHLRLATVVAGKASAKDFIGNFLADAVAGAAAEHALSVSPSAGSIGAWEHKTWLIANRLAAIEALHRAEGPRLVPEPRLASHLTKPIDVSAGSLMAQAEAAGHALRWRGKSTAYCTNCRKRHKADRFLEWARNPCSGRKAGDSVKPPGRGSDSASLEARNALSTGSPRCAGITPKAYSEDIPDTAISISKRKRLMRDIAQQAAQRRAEEHVARSKAIEHGIDMLPIERVRALPFTDALPFEPHPSHTVICCGGYAGCFRCGSVTGFVEPRRLRAACRATCPMGSRGPINRLAKGKLPTKQAGGLAVQWPTGEVNPAPALYLRTRQRTDVAASQAVGTASGGGMAEDHGPGSTACPVVFVPTRPALGEQRPARKRQRFRL